jgi:hypothetical protein
MTPEKLVELLENPKVTEKMIGLLDDPYVAEKLADLLREPVVTERVTALLQSQAVRTTVEGYFDAAVAGAIVLVALTALNLLTAIYNTILLRRISQNVER